MNSAEDVFGQGTRFQQELSGPLANPGYVKGFAGVGSQVSGFLGGSEPPVFYDIGNIQAARAMRSKNGHSVIQRDGRGVLVKDGVDVDTSYGGAEKNYYYKSSKDGKWYECPPGYRTTANGDSCYLPEGMADPLKITTSGFGQRDPFADIEDTVYGG